MRYKELGHEREKREKRKAGQLLERTFWGVRSQHLIRTHLEHPIIYTEIVNTPHQEYLVKQRMGIMNKWLSSL